MSVSVKQIIFINEYPFLYGGTEHYIYQVARQLKDSGYHTTLMYSGIHLPDKKIASSFDDLFPIIDIDSQLKEMPEGIIYINNYRDPKLIETLTEVKNPVFRYIHDHYLTCPRSSKTSPISNETCTKKVGLSCYNCGVVSRPEGKIKIRTPNATKKELEYHNKFNNIIVSSQYLQREMTRNGVLHKRITINPIYQSNLFEHSKIKIVKKHSQILFVGSLIKGKGVDLLIIALSQIRHSFHLKIIGDGAWMQRLKDLAKKNSSASTIEFLGNISHDKLAHYYKESKAVIVPSTLPETFSKAGADGLHFGTLPICADVGGISSWLKPEKNGVLFQGGSIEDLSKCLCNLAEKKYDHIIEKIRYTPSTLPSIQQHTNRLLEIFNLELNRRIPPKKYSYSENEQFINIMDKTCEQFKGIALKHLGKKVVNSIILIGGYGRGEGGVVEKNNILYPHNNLDFQIILNTIRVGNITDKRQAIIEDIQKITKDKMITLDFSFNTKSKVRFGIPQLVYYDMKYGHRLVYGEDSWLLNIKKYHSQNISLHDIRELLINRGTLLILNKKMLEKEKITTEEKMVVVKHFVKAIIGYGDALLYLNGKYHWSYKRKKELMWTISPTYPAFSRMYSYAINFRFNPDYQRIIQSDLKMIQRFVVRNVEKIHLKFEKEVSKQENLNWDTYFDLVMTRPLYLKKLNFLNLTKLIINSFSPSSRTVAKSLQENNIIGNKFIGNKSFLMALFPYVLYDIESSEKEFTNDESILDFYIKTWGETNDENFDQSLPGKIISRNAA